LLFENRTCPGKTGQLVTLVNLLINNDMISDYNLDVLCLTETWLKPNDYITLNESTPHDYSYKHEPCL